MSLFSDALLFVLSVAVIAMVFVEIHKNHKDPAWQAYYKEYLEHKDDPEYEGYWD